MKYIHLNFRSVQKFTETEVEPAELLLRRAMPSSYKMSRGVKTITDLWWEWHSGLAGGVSVQYMNEKFGAYWRNNDRQFYNKRRRMIENDLSKL
jgi:hypothetical protein